jgi:hypothetical protein
MLVGEDRRALPALFDVLGQGRKVLRAKVRQHIVMELPFGHRDLLSFGSMSYVAMRHTMSTPSTPKRLNG